ncbi:alpha/beta hydrolase [soil metagenome]
MTSMGSWLLRIAGLLIFVAAIGFGATKAPDRPLASLVARWAPPPSDFVDVKGQLVHLRDVGPRDDVQPIVQIHGTSASLHTWEGWVAALEKEHRVITFDLPGFGLTGPSADGDYSDTAYIDFVAALLDKLKLRQVILGGNSLGGEIAWEFAAAQPARVSALILVDAAGYAFTPATLPLGFRIARTPGLRQITRFVLPRSVIEKSVREVYGDPSKVTAELIDRYFELTLREGNRGALLQRIDQLNAGQFVGQLAGLHMPTLILWGGRDRLIPPDNADAFKRDIVGSRLVRFPALGHVPQEEDPAATLVPVQAFLKSLPIINKT